MEAGKRRKHNVLLTQEEEQTDVKNDLKRLLRKNVMS